jgi:hypothetical protein
MRREWYSDGYGIRLDKWYDAFIIVLCVVVLVGIIGGGIYWIIRFMGTLTGGGPA